MNLCSVDVTRGEIALYLAVAVTAVGLTALQVRLDRSVFDRYLVGLPPAVVVTIVALVGLPVLVRLGSSGLRMLGPDGFGSALVLMAWAVPMLAAVAIGIDLWLRFPEDMNVAVPQALAFYPAIALVVEVVLHAVPILLLVSLLGAPVDVSSFSFWRIALPVAALEAALQAAFASTAGLAALSGLHLMVFGVVQVYVFVRFGFLPMYFFRLTYYALWHIGWGSARLPLLF